jgi:phospholipid/cholesterol/gamma-HCH transport system substrate-binding protein
MTPEKRIERSVGIFVLVGITITATMILYFGKVGDRFRGGYPITVEFGNAGALVKGAQVLYAGVLVGKVHAIELKPDASGVVVDVAMFKSGQIRQDASFLIKQSGLLGDQNIVIVARSNTAPFLKAGDQVRGVDPFDFSEAATQAGDAIRKLNAAIDRLSTDMLTGDGIDNLKRGVKNFADLAQKLQTNSERLNTILNRVEKGDGTVGKLLNDDGLFIELKTLIHNWRVHGLLYREKSSEKYPQPKKSQVPYGVEEEGSSNPKSSLSSEPSSKLASGKGESAALENKVTPASH